MKRILNLLLTAVALVGVVSSCQKDDVDNYDIESVPGYGSDLTITLPADFSDTVPLESIICEIRTSTPELKFITATHTLVDGKSTLLLDEALPTGSNILRAVRYTGYTRATDYSEVMMGCIVNVLAEKNNLSTSSYNETYNFFGSGTSTDPFLIGSAMGFANINNMDRTDFYFQQIDSIDFYRYFGHETGFEGICPEYNKPFNGYFSGGADSGLTISNLAVRRYTEEQSNVDTWGSINPAGLFCYVSGAVIEKVLMDNPHLVGDEGVGGVVGLILGASGNSSAVSIINECQLIRSVENDNKIFGTGCVGGIVGAIEYQGNAVISNCSVAKNLIIRAHTDAGGGNYLGGIIGASGLYATLNISNCENNAYIEGDGITNLGGIIGAAQTIRMMNCTNNADITLLNGSDNSIAVGGLIGGSTDAIISGSINNGAISGTRGVGGLIGSALMDTNTTPTEDDPDPTDTYGSVAIYASHNYGDILGTRSVGGLAGEAQVAAVKCYNGGDVGTHSVAGTTYQDPEVGGLVGFGSYLIASGSHNAGAVNGSYSGGLAGVAEHFFVYACSNFGAVNGSTSTGGMVGRTCEYGLMNYCSNFADIVGTSSYTGGMVGRLGNHLSTADKKASLAKDAELEAVIFAAKIVLEGACMYGEHALSKPKAKNDDGIYVSAELTDDRFKSKSGCSAEIMGHVPVLGDIAEVAWYISECVKEWNEISEEEEETKEELEEDSEGDEESDEAELGTGLTKLRDQWQTAAEDGADTMNSKLSTNLDNLIANSQYQYRGDMDLTQNIAKQILDNIRSYADKIDSDSGDVSSVDTALTNNSFSGLVDLCEDIAKAKKIEAVLECVEKCAIAAISVACGEVVGEVMKAAKTIEKVAAKFGVILAGSLATTGVEAQAEFTKDDSNTIIMNQCSNFGAVTGGNGIVGEIGDRVYIKNILSAGKVDGYAVANEADGKNLYDSNILCIGTNGRALYPDKVINSSDNTNVFVYGDGTNGTTTAAKLKSKDTYGDNTYKGDDDWSWGLWSMSDSDEIPTFGQCMYYDFM